MPRDNEEMRRIVVSPALRCSIKSPGRYE